MEDALSDIDLEKRQKACGEVIFNAISSPDPIRSMTRSVDAIRKGCSVPKMINCVASFLDVPRTVAEEILASGVV